MVGHNVPALSPQVVLISFNMALCSLHLSPHPSGSLLFFSLPDMPTQLDCSCPYTFASLDIFQMPDLGYWLHVCMWFWCMRFESSIYARCTIAHALVYVATQIRMLVLNSVPQLQQPFHILLGVVVHGMMKEDQNDLSADCSCALRIYVCPYLLFQLKQKCVTLFRSLEALGSFPFLLMQSSHDLHLLLDYHQNHISRCFRFVSRCASTLAFVHAKSPLLHWTYIHTHLLLAQVKLWLFLVLLIS